MRSPESILVLPFVRFSPSRLRRYDQFLDRLPLVVGQDLAFLVGPVLADHHEGRQEDRLQRHDHGQQPIGVVLDAQDDPGGEPDDVEVDELHRPGEPGDLVGDPVLQALAALLGVLEQRRIDGDGERSCAHASSFGLVPSLGRDPPRMPALKAATNWRSTTTVAAPACRSGRRARP
jgi:hypothetical protein